MGKLETGGPKTRPAGEVPRRRGGEAIAKQDFEPVAFAPHTGRTTVLTERERESLKSLRFSPKSP